MIRQGFCKCGTRAKIGDKFLYKSVYGSEVRGIVAVVGYRSIESSEGVRYPNDEIEIKTIDIKRNEKLDQLGL